MLNQTAILARHGYGVLVTSVRAHDFSGGTQVSFGLQLRHLWRAIHAHWLIAGLLAVCGVSIGCCTLSPDGAGCAAGRSQLRWRLLVSLCRPHDLRHTFIGDLLAAEVDIAVIQRHEGVLTHTPMGATISW
ncbi:MAG: hypothetical protein HGA45_27660 [Chloroflexales bacterium]|nr:hypothetical protein [Chloroflexales bacterium]